MLVTAAELKDILSDFRELLFWIFPKKLTKALCLS